MNELLPCPFCGGEAFINLERDCRWVECRKCGAMGYVEIGGETEAIEAWNIRAERTCRMSPSDHYPCAEDDCMRLKVRMWTCSECEADHVGSKPNYCHNCGAKVVIE